MKIAILSMQRIYNYGSLLQAYSLKKEIERIGNEVFFIDIEKNNDDNKLLHSDSLVDYSSESITPPPGLLKRLNVYRRYKKRKERGLQNSVFERFQNDVLKLSADASKDIFSCCVIGSDEVFNCMQPSPWGYTSQLFGNVRQAKKVITYAASCGYTNCEMVPERVQQSISKSLEKVNALSVRDENTFDFINKLTGRKPDIHLDPVAIGDFEEEIKAQDISKKLPKRYCIYYVYSNRINDEKQISRIKKFCRDNNLTLIAIGGHHNWIDKHPALNPFEVLLAFRNAEFVITDTFHGALFSIKYAKRFAIYVQKSNANKINDLVSRIDVHNHLISDFDDLERAYSLLSDRNRIDQVLMAERMRSLEYLHDNL